jgi:DNA polymerase-3 subunit beta
MKATVQRTLFLETLENVKVAIGHDMRVPTSSCVLIHADKDELSLTANNLAIALSARCKASVREQGEVAIPTSLLLAFVRAAKAETLILTSGPHNALMMESGATTTLEGYDPKNFPPVPEVKGDTIMISGLASALSEISYAMANDESRPVLTGVDFRPNDDKIVLAAADGFRLGVTTVSAKGKLEPMIVQGKAIRAIQELMPGTVSVCQGNHNTTSFTCQGLMLTSPAIQGTFPQYDKIIPQHGADCVVDSQALRDALDIVSVTLGGSDIVRLQTKGTNLIISTQDEELGQTQAVVPAQGECRIAFQAKYLKDILMRLSGSISLSITNASTPMLVRQGETIHVLMPMFVQW